MIENLFSHNNYDKYTFFISVSYNEYILILIYKNDKKPINCFIGLCSCNMHADLSYSHANSATVAHVEHGCACLYNNVIVFCKEMAIGTKI